MRIVIELFNSSGCSLNSKIVDLVEGEDASKRIAAAVIDFVNGGVLDPGDTIRISEIQ